MHFAGKLKSGHPVGINVLNSRKLETYSMGFFKMWVSTSYLDTLEAKCLGPPVSDMRTEKQLWEKIEL